MSRVRTLLIDYVDFGRRSPSTEFRSSRPKSFVGIAPTLSLRGGPPPRSLPESPPTILQSVVSGHRRAGLEELQWSRRPRPPRRRRSRARRCRATVFGRFRRGPHGRRSRRRRETLAEIDAELRADNQVDRLPALAANTGCQPAESDVIVTLARAARSPPEAATAETPIGFQIAEDPVRAGPCRQPRQAGRKRDGYQFLGTRTQRKAA